MNAFSTGTSITTVIYPETMTLLIGLVDWKLDAFGNKIYQWHNARVRPAAADMPERIASMADLWQIAAFLDNRGGSAITRHGAAKSQLRAYVLLAVDLFKRSNHIDGSDEMVLAA
jgi:hypothetical protein